MLHVNSADLQNMACRTIEMGTYYYNISNYLINILGQVQTNLIIA